MDRSLLTRPLSGAPCLSSYRFALWPLYCGRVMFLPAIYIRYGQIVPFYHPLSLIVTDSPFLSGFPLRRIAAFHALNADSLRNVSELRTGGRLWHWLASIGAGRDNPTGRKICGRQRHSPAYIISGTVFPITTTCQRCNTRQHTAKPCQA